MLGRHRKGREGEGEERARMREETATRWDACGCTGFGDRSESCGGRPRGNERAASESEDTNHGRVTDLRRLTGEPRP